MRKKNDDQAEKIRRWWILSKSTGQRVEGPFLTEEMAQCALNPTQRRLGPCVIEEE